MGGKDCRGRGGWTYWPGAASPAATRVSRWASPYSGTGRTILAVGIVTLLVAGFVLALPNPSVRTAAHGAAGFRPAGAPSGLGCATQNSVGTLSVVSPVSASGSVGSHVTLEGSGFFSIDSIFLFFAPSPGTEYRQVGSVAPHTAEPFQATVIVPDGSLDDPLGLAEFWALDAGSNCASAAFTITAIPPSGVSCVSFDASLTVAFPSPASGPAGTNVTLDGAGFYLMGGAGLSWAPPDGSSAYPVGSASGGTFTTNVTVPGGYSPGTYLFWGVDGIDDCASAEFNLTGSSGPTLTLNPTSGPVGEVVAATGSGFADSSTVTFTFDGTGVASICQTNGTGSFPGTTGTPCLFAVPAAPSGNDSGGNVIATDAFSNSAAASFNVTPDLTITSTPTTGPVGTPVTVTGSGWIPGDYILLETGPVGDDDATGSVWCADTSGGEATVNASGGFTCDFDFPSVGPGVYSVLATDETQITTPVTIIYSTNTFTVPVAPVISVNPTSEPAGATFTVTGSGFSPYPSGSIVSFDGDLISPNGGSDCSYAGPLITLDSSGGFVCTFAVPASATTGPHDLQGEDTATGDLSPVVTLTVTEGLPTVTVLASPSTISLKESTIVTVTVSGTGLTPTGSVTISDGLSGQNDSCVISTLNSSGSGNCELTPSHFGHLTLTATYGGDSNYESAVGTTPLFVNTEDLTISPSSGSRDETLDVVLGGFTPATSGMQVIFGNSKSLEGAKSVNAFTVDSVTITGLSNITVEITIALHAKLGLYTVWVVIETSGARSTTVETLMMGSFRVTSFAPTMSPSIGSQDETLDVVLGGFTPAPSGMTVMFGNSRSGIAVDSVTITGLSNITVQITISDHAKIRRDAVQVVIVTKTGSRETVDTFDMGKFTVLAFAPTITPTSGSLGETLNVTLAGFTVSPVASDMTVTFGGPSSEIAVDSVLITGLSSITVKITIAFSASVGPDPVMVVESVPGGVNTFTTLTLVGFQVTQ